MIDYIAPFASSEASGGETRIDYLLPPDEDAEDASSGVPTQPQAQ